MSLFLDIFVLSIDSLPCLNYKNILLKLSLGKGWRENSAIIIGYVKAENVMPL